MAPVLPPAPGRFSTTTGCPSAGDSCSAIRRAMMSAAPPAPEDTTIWIGRDGQLCAWPCVDDRASRPSSRSAVRFIIVSSQRRSVRLNAGVLHHLAPYGDVVLDLLVVVGGRA